MRVFEIEWLMILKQPHLKHASLNFLHSPSSQSIFSISITGILLSSILLCNDEQTTDIPHTRFSSNRKPIYIYIFKIDLLWGKVFFSSYISFIKFINVNAMFNR
ncbi:hypothetical protein V8G54_015144 [Vigna mungo]|uniref:Uncharacterized protein n=1 Tax=Vigna mungo TaxID=3915 RepID=A0AAQ3RWK9_VIGMU